MITYKKLKWSNAFSYGEDNELDLVSSPLTQLIGKNGYGKSSIALILEEVLFNTNSKKIKKGDILNRYTKSKNYTISVVFDKDGVEYEVTTIRTNTTSVVKLRREGIDISSHTATATYKTIEEIIGYDHKMFSQIVYQSSVSSLEFLTATDTTRKKFLIELLNLTQYTKASEIFKELASNKSKELDGLKTKEATISSWLAKYEGEDLNIKQLKTEEEEPKPLKLRLQEIGSEIANIVRTNKDIERNNTYKKILAGIVLPEFVPILSNNEDILALQVSLAAKQKRLTEGRSLVGTLPITKCKSCSQAIDNSTRYEMFKKYESEVPSIEAEIVELQNKIKAHQTNISKVSAYNIALAETEKYINLIDNELPEAIVDRVALEADLSRVSKLITQIEEKIREVRKYNKEVDAHNTKVSVIIAQLNDMRKDLASNSVLLKKVASDLSILQTLVKAFSPTGLVAYKIECLVKDLEEITNEYLGNLADGRFQLSFKITSADKLNVVITDNGTDIDIVALSSGERARVNVATLLAIRKLMQALSNSRTNLLILDETVENLDAEGKERLIDILLNEEHLNTILVSHSFTHPLISKIAVNKINNISRLEDI